MPQSSRPEPTEGVLARLAFAARTRRSLALAAAGALTLGLASPGAQAAELSAEERLNAVRHELLQAALDGPTQVHSTAWIDANGALREASSFRHGMQVRGIRVLAYSRDESGQPRAQLQLQGREDLVGPQAGAPAGRTTPGSVASTAVQGAPAGQPRPETARASSLSAASAGANSSKAAGNASANPNASASPNASANPNASASASSSASANSKAKLSSPVGPAAHAAQAAAQPAGSGAGPAAQASAASAPSAPEAACPAGAGLRHVLGWSLATQGRWNVDELHLVQESRQILAQAWRERAEASPAWRLVDAPATPPVARPVGTLALYERLLTSAPAQPQAQLQARWRLTELPPRANEGRGHRLDNTPRLQVALSVAAADGMPVYEARTDLLLAPRQTLWSPPRLAEPSVLALQALVAQWSQALAERLGCQPVQVQVLRSEADRVQVDQGALAGLRLGDEWLLSDHRKVPQRVLEPGGADQIVLARVERLEPQRAELRIVAGPAGQVRPRWQAWPVEQP